MGLDTVVRRINRAWSTARSRATGPPGHGSKSGAGPAGPVHFSLASVKQGRRPAPMLLLPSPFCGLYTGIHLARGSWQRHAATTGQGGLMEVSLLNPYWTCNSVITTYLSDGHQPPKQANLPIMPRLFDAPGIYGLDGCIALTTRRSRLGRHHRAAMPAPGGQEEWFTRQDEMKDHRRILAGTPPPTGWLKAGGGRVLVLRRLQLGPLLESGSLRIESAAQRPPGGRRIFLPLPHPFRGRLDSRHAPAWASTPRRCKFGLDREGEIA